ncbi:formylglycine-generating enzyme family protein [Candidatus Photodesmus blepharus]|uniref:formylglycine-generating enzyme family protein n=1 Tax=Candidatus Photodesmus blepharonis TaxID=1179155 RepID=UPI00055153E3|nr:formylglycine-generating enzyme family protein [Candidatus Photodesmus blepharus]
MQQSSAVLIFVISTYLATTLVMASQTYSSIIEIENAIFDRRSELSKAYKKKEECKQVIQNEQKQLVTLNFKAEKLNKLLNKTKSNFDHEYQKMINNPKLNLMRLQNSYRKVWMEVKENQSNRLKQEKKLKELQTQLIKKEANIKTIKLHLIQLEEKKIRARTSRLKKELKRNDTQQVIFTNTCDTTMTFEQCKKQTETLAQEKVIDEFQKIIITETTESDLIKKNVDNGLLDIHLLHYETFESGFYDDKHYKIILNANLATYPSETIACKLLKLESKYCFAFGDHSTTKFTQNEKVAWVKLRVDSNQHNDNISIDGISYGSSPVEIMLPTGPHMITIEKEGYHSFIQKKIDINADKILKAILKEKENKLIAGYKFADSLPGKHEAPSMVALIPSKYSNSKKLSKKVNFPYAFGIGLTPVTVEQFANFVNITNYLTEAENKHTCTTINDSKNIPIPNGSWRNPGFKQFNNSPVVCISKNDAKAYTQWLSKETGYTYRLPSEDEWEIAALLDSQDNYWWGNEFKPGEANTGWGGTLWSNQGTSPVRAFSPNQIGLYDMVGNVWEWTNDKRGIVKGGAWIFSPNMAAADKRLFLAESSSSNYTGFRVVRDINNNLTN